MSRYVEIESSSVESVTVVFRATADPTGDAIEFCTTAETATDPAATWEAGAWVGYANGRAVATTATLGDTGAALPLAEGERLRLWCRIAGSTVLLVGTVSAG